MGPEQMQALSLVHQTHLLLRQYLEGLHRRDSYLIKRRLLGFEKHKFLIQQYLYRLDVEALLYAIAVSYTHLTLPTSDLV